MIKNMMMCFSFSICCVSVVYADSDAIHVLKHRLKLINNNFYTHITQEIMDINGKVIATGKGELWVKRPNFFHWHMLSPEENFLIFDSKTIWFYVPLIKQVTVLCLKNSIFNHVFLKFLLNYEIFDHNYCDVIQNQDWFYLKPTIGGRNDLKSCEIKISDCGKVDRFVILKSNGYRINYYLYKQSNEVIDVTKFKFIIPDDVQLDDQRYNS